MKTTFLTIALALATVFGASAHDLAGKMCSTEIHSEIAGDKLRMVVDFADSDSCHVVLIDEQLRTEYGAQAVIVIIVKTPAHYSVDGDHLTVDFYTDQIVVDMNGHVVGDTDDRTREYCKRALDHEIESARDFLKRDYQLLLPQLSEMTIVGVTDDEVELTLDATPSRFPDMEGSRIRP